MCKRSIVQMLDIDDPLWKPLDTEAGIVTVEDYEAPPLIFLLDRQPTASCVTLI